MLNCWFSADGNNKPWYKPIEGNGSTLVRFSMLSINLLVYPTGKSEQLCKMIHFLLIEMNKSRNI